MIFERFSYSREEVDWLIRSIMEEDVDLIPALSQTISRLLNNTIDRIYYSIEQYLETMYPRQGSPDSETLAYIQNVYDTLMIVKKELEGQIKVLCEKNFNGADSSSVSGILSYMFDDTDGDKSDNNTDGEDSGSDLNVEY